MREIIVTDKGIDTADILQHMGVATGDTIKLYLLPNGTVTLRSSKVDMLPTPTSPSSLRLRDRPKRDIAEMAGMLKGRSPHKLSIEEMNAVIAQGWAGELDER